MWAVWALIGTFFTAPWAARGGSCPTAGALPVSQMVLERPVPFDPTRQEVVPMLQVRVWFFYLLTPL